MPLSRKNRFVWNEPWFFVQRVRHPLAWAAWTFFLTVLAIGVGFALYQSKPAGQPTSWLQVISLSLGAAAIVWWVFDGTETRRQAKLTDTQLVVGGDMGKYSHPTTYELSEIEAFAIVRPEVSKWPSDALYFIYDDAEQAVGIGPGVALERLAKAIHGIGKPITLDGWSAGELPDWLDSLQWQREGEPTAVANIETLSPDQPSFMSPGSMAWAVFQQTWPFLLWLGLSIYGVWYLYQNWANLGGLEPIIVLALVIFGALAMAQLTERYSTAATSKTLGKMVLRQIRKRSGVELDLTSKDLFETEVRELDQMDKQVFKIRETALMQTDAAGFCWRAKKNAGTCPPTASRRCGLKRFKWERRANRRWDNCCTSSSFGSALPPMNSSMAFGTTHEILAVSTMSNGPKPACGCSNPSCR